MLSRHRSSFRVFPNWLLTAVSGACVIAGTAVIVTPPAAGAAPLADAVQAAPPVTLAAPVVTRAPHVSDPRHAWHERHMAHVLFLENQARARAAAAWAAAHPPKVSRDTFTKSTPVTVSGYSGIQACIIRTESGGDPNIWNATGHYGLYQFSYGTWTAHGGNPADFGHASVTEQNQVFANTVAVDGYSDWTPYDGC